jgi:hypothetical protein
MNPDGCAEPEEAAGCVVMAVQLNAWHHDGDWLCCLTEKRTNILGETTRIDIEIDCQIVKRDMILYGPGRDTYSSGCLCLLGTSLSGRPLTRRAFGK